MLDVDQVQALGVPEEDESSEPARGTCAVASARIRSACRPSGSPRSMNPDSMMNTTRGRLIANRSQTPLATRPSVRARRWSHT